MNELNEAEKAFVDSALAKNVREFSLAGQAMILTMAELLNVTPDHVYTIYEEKRKQINKHILNR